ncbi:hypothetical protein [Mycobacterium stomatepiae]|uniref:Uncharacterized protein n=1 Tax=Mycobacterium stomatepiae TaxID=470076 RepID=A0A7I7Q3S8_9MYCO|nr:hypothetical protein [Mycobacterium stomatepiae]MCV7165789.1 hypothetical protein [Mycobacterium stomatepiae]BBY20646.1 hypothetical protein MSTO_08510 [Mycobacterium stomatepiae]
MVGLGQLALDSAPALGAVLLAIAAIQFRGPDYRQLIQQDMDLLERLPPEATERRDALRNSIDARIDDLVESANRSRAWRRAAMSYQGDWRDVVVMLCAVLFTIVWWGVDHSRGNWMPMFILLILLCVVAAAYAFRGVLRAASAFVHKRHTGEQDARK